MKLETLQAYAGSRNKQIANFKRQARTALGQLVDVGFLTTFKLEGDLPHIQHSGKTTTFG